MKYLFELSKEYASLAAEEIKHCLHAEHISFDIVLETEEVLLIESIAPIDMIKDLKSRLAFTYSISMFLFSSPANLKDLKNAIKQQVIDVPGTIAVSYRNRSHSISSRDIIPPIADVYTLERTVDLQQPDIEVRVIITNDFLYVGHVIARINRVSFEERKAQYRPFFSPISLHPKIARVLINYTETRPGEILLDPFCGTGGILIEAGLLGMHPAGVDVKEDYVHGCQENLSHYHITNATLYTADVGQLPTLFPEGVDGIVTDFPYGKASTLHGEQKEQLYERGFHAISKVIRPHRRVIVGISDTSMKTIGSKYLTFVGELPFRVHRSLTRYFVIYTR